MFSRFIGELVVGMLFGFLVRTAIPEDLMQGKSPFQILTLVVPYAVAVGEQIKHLIYH